MEAGWCECLWFQSFFVKHSEVIWGVFEKIIFFPPDPLAWAVGCDHCHIVIAKYIVVICDDINYLDGVRRNSMKYFLHLVANGSSAPHRENPGNRFLCFPLVHASHPAAMYPCAFLRVQFLDGLACIIPFGMWWMCTHFWRWVCMNNTCCDLQTAWRSWVGVLLVGW